MRAKLTTLSILALAGWLAACSPKAGADASASATASETPAQTMSNMSDMSGMTMPVSAKSGSSTGVVTAIDKAAGTVTIKHEAIPAVDWPAMTMAFKATPASLLDSLKVGEKVSFDVKVKGSDAEVTAVTPQ